MKDKSSIINKIIIYISLVCLTILLLGNKGDIKTNLFIIFLSLIAAFYIVFVKYKDVFYNKKRVIFISFVSLYYIKFCTVFCGRNSIIYKIISHFSLSENYFRYLKYIIGFASVPAVIYLFLLLIDWIYPKIIKFYKSMTKAEKSFILYTGVIAFILIFIIFNLTNVFYLDNLREYDIVYTSDSSFLYIEDAFMNVYMAENDLRQPLFGVSALPFAMFCHFIGDNFILGTNGYAIMLSTIQYICISISLVLLSRMLNLKGDKQKLFFLFSYSCFSRLIFGLVIEQYVFAMFYLILAIYMFIDNEEEINYMYIPAVGTLITTGVIFPLISKFKNIKYWIKNVFNCFIVFMCTAIISGRIYELLILKRRLTWLMGYSGKELLFSDKLLQFLNFISSIFIAPISNIVVDNGFHAYRLTEVSNVNIFGIILLIIALLGFILNKKTKFSIISMCWIIFSFIVLCVVGWGTAENGLILYSLYFDWAFISLIYMFILKVFNKKTSYKYVIITLSLIMFFINIYEIINIIQFGLQYY